MAAANGYAVGSSDHRSSFDHFVVRSGNVQFGSSPSRVTGTCLAPNCEIVLSNARSSNPSITTRGRIPVVGIVGGIGSGKSAVANWVGAHANVSVLNADQLGHEALKSDEVKDALRRRFGDSIVAPDGNLDRKAIAREVFGSEPEHQAARHDLEQIVHPEIGRRIAEGIDQAQRDHKEAAIVDAAIMLETGWRSKCDLIVFVDTSDATRLARVRQNRGWSELELQKREASQWSLSEKRRQSDVIIDNNGDVEDAGRQLLSTLVEQRVIQSEGKKLTRGNDVGRN